MSHDDADGICGMENICFSPGQADLLEYDNEDDIEGQKADVSGGGDEDVVQGYSHTQSGLEAFQQDVKRRMQRFDKQVTKLTSGRSETGSRYGDDYSRDTSILNSKKRYGFRSSKNKSKNTKGDTGSVTSDGSSGLEDTRIQAKVFMISGCEDVQTSADVSNVSSFSLPDPNGRAGGACTSALLKVLYESGDQQNSGLTFGQVLRRMRTVLRKGGYSQIPQLSSSRKMDVGQSFYIAPPDCTGTKRAVLIGINYEGQDGELSGCHNDCLNMKDYIKDAFGFEEENILVLMDDGVHDSPTRTNILGAYRAVAAMSASGDAVFCHYSGHGGRIRDDDWGEEDDGYDETLVPVDYASRGQIRDDDVYESLVCAMPAGSTLVSLMDCCHSGTVLDLPYKYNADGTGTGYGSTNSSGFASGGGVQALAQSGKGKVLILAGICAVIVFLIVLVPQIFAEK